ncbi:hypothetical protein Pmani_036935 [Petrolisthes manimaculis]|uniref:Uncharacterized protein n=1 Tax=Petrolisthes manimaculis TaxID=1843537 RepID=A0AAE1TLP2_9EUCA|nr:hypothetical protein Pmani_036935 [Petrolisthes manimaculis]
MLFLSIFHLVLKCILPIPPDLNCHKTDHAPPIVIHSLHQSTTTHHHFVPYHFAPYHPPTTTHIPSTPPYHHSPAPLYHSSPPTLLYPIPTTTTVRVLLYTPPLPHPIHHFHLLHNPYPLHTHPHHPYPHHYHAPPLPSPPPLSPRPPLPSSTPPPRPTTKALLPRGTPTLS